MHSPDTVKIIYNSLTDNENGEPVNVVSEFDVYCYIDFSSGSLKKTNNNNESIVIKYTVFINDFKETQKLININKGNIQDYAIKIANQTFNIVDINKGLNHVELYV